MSQPSRPRYQAQGPANACNINGKQMGWLNCGPTAFAMAIDKATLNVKLPTGCSIRRLTGDTIGGTTLRQCADAAHKLGVHVDVFSGSGVADPEYVWQQAKKGRGFVLQGNTSALLNTKFRSTTGAVNHAVYGNEVKGSGANRQALMYDPAADNRRKGIDKGPSWWPWSLVLKFAAALRPWGDNDSRLLGPGRMYVGIFPDTEPHAHLRFGGFKTSPFPDRTRTTKQPTNVHSRPDRSPDTIVAKLAKGVTFEAWQKTNTGETFQGSRVWYGNHDGTKWVHAARLSHEGGST